MMLYPEIGKLMKNMDSRYTLVTVVAKRARQLSIDTVDDKCVSRAVNEVANGKVRCIHRDDTVKSDDNTEKQNTDAMQDAE